MGMSASQARLLLLTARKSDTEYRVQQINNRRLALTYQLEEIAKAYSDGIADRKLYISSEDGELVDLTIANLSDILGYTVKSRDGGAVSDTLSSELLEIGLRSGKYYLEGTDPDDSTQTVEVDWRTSTAIEDNLNEDNDEEVMAEYEYQSSKVQSQDKRLELELKQLETEHKAIETEVDAVKKVIEKNIESSFKTFG